MPTTVVNLRNQEYDIPIGRPSLFGNPFSHLENSLAKFKVTSRDEAVDLYSEWAPKQPKIMAALPSLKNLRLGCYCVPARCHGEIVVELVDGFYPKAPDIINEFRSKNRTYSNFSFVEVVYEGVAYRSVEHAYQAAKSLDNGTRKLIASLPRPGDAKRAGGSIPLRSGWNTLRVSVMECLLREKFGSANWYHHHKLLATGQAELVEGNTWHDLFWGCCSCPLHQGAGENQLGKLLMKLRSEYGIKH